MSKFKEGDKVVWRGMGVTGKVRRVRSGTEHGGDLYTVYTDDPKATPDGMFVAREYELQARDSAPAKDSDRRARLHRALDAMMDRKAVKDAEDPHDEKTWNMASLATRLRWLSDEFDDDDASALINKRWFQLSAGYRDRISGLCIPISARKATRDARRRA